MLAALSALAFGLATPIVAWAGRDVGPLTTAALLYAILVEWLVTRDLHPRRGLPQALAKSTVLTGAVLILLASALGLTSYLVDAQIPDQLLAWVKTHVESKLLFLLALNLILLVLGSVVAIMTARTETS